jgi:hypothetical protein
MAKPPRISMQEWTEEPLFGTKHSGYAETEGRTGFRIGIRSGSVSRSEVALGAVQGTQSEIPSGPTQWPRHRPRAKSEFSCAVGWDARLVTFAT